MKSADFRGIRITGGGPGEIVEALIHSIGLRVSLRVSFVNPHSFNLLRTDPRLRGDLQALDLVCVDGVGVTWMVRLLTGARLERLSFDLLAPTLFERAAATGAQVFLLGGRAGTAAEAARILQARHTGLRIAGSHHGYALENLLEPLAREIGTTDTVLLVIGAGAPAQEMLAVELGRLLPGVSIVTCGGYFDQVRRASPYYPRWAYPLRLNWLVRLIREPRRLWRRYLLGTPRFVVDSLLWRLHQGTTTRRPMS